ncbi:methyltransferase domain-containing protein [Candidatus Omnitrophota bacterium]
MLTNSTKRIDFIIDNIKRRQNGRPNAEVAVIDFGCGVGDIALALAGLGYDVLGLDSDGASIDHLNKNNSFPNAKFTRQDVFDISLEKRYDFAVCSEFFEHVHDPIRLARVVYGMLKPDGVLILTVPNGWGAYELSTRFHRTLARFGIAGPMKLFKKGLSKISLWPFPERERTTLNFKDRHIQFFTFKRIKKIFEKAGYVIVEVRNSDILSSVFPFAIISRLLPRFASIDQRIADHLPRFAVSGWYFAAKKGKGRGGTEMGGTEMNPAPARRGGVKTGFCLITPVGRSYEPYMPYALMSIASFLEKSGVKTDIVDIKKNPYERKRRNTNQEIEDDILRSVKEKDPSVVGITCLVNEVLDVRRMLQRVKEFNKGVKTVVGGVHPSMFPEDFLYEGSPVDYVVIGEGEYTALDLWKVLRGEKRKEEVRGIAYFEQGRIIRTPPRPAIEDLDELPMLSYDKIDMGYYVQPTIYSIRTLLVSSLNIFTSRGCPSQCTFCVNKNLSEVMCSRNVVRKRSAKKVVDEIELLVKRYRIDGFYIWDDTFILSKEYVREFCRELLARDIDVIWAAETKVNMISSDIVKEMQAAGCIQIDFGVESGSQEILNRIKKGITVKQIKNAFSVCRGLSMRTFANFMFNTPGETEQDVKKTIDLARELDANCYNFSVCTPFPGTDIYRSAGLRLSVDEYSLFDNAMTKLADPRFKLADHDLDLEDLSVGAHRSFNTIGKRTSFLFNEKYIKRMLKSKRKRDYLNILFRLGTLFIELELGHLAKKRSFSVLKKRLLRNTNGGRKKAA